MIGDLTSVNSKPAYEQAGWRLHGPFADVVRDPNGSRRIAELEADSNAAYQNALMWGLTSQEAHARRAIEILNAWSGKLRTITGHDKQLAALLCGFQLVNAAELLRGTDSGWQAQDITQFKRMRFIPSSRTSPPPPTATHPRSAQHSGAPQSNFLSAGAARGPAATIDLVKRARI